MAYLLKFSGDVEYTFPNTFYPSDRSLANVVPTAKLARAHGARVLTGYKGERRLTIRGGFVGPGAPFGAVSNFQGEIDDLNEALNSGPGLLYFGEDDFVFRCCQWENFGQPYDPTYWNRILSGGEIAFITGDPYRYSTGTPNTDTWTSPSTTDTRSITNAGRAPAAPTIRITVGGSGPETIAYALENTTTGESFTLAGDVAAGDVIVIDSLPPKSVTIATVDERVLFEGQFLTLKPGANVFQVTITTGTIDSIETEWMDRKL